MIVQMDMPYSTAWLTPNDKLSGVNKLKKLLTATVVRFSPRGDHSTEKICLFEDLPVVNGAQGYRFRTGLLYRIQRDSLLCNMAVERVDDLRATPQPGALDYYGVTNRKIVLRDYQERIVTQTLKHDMGVMCAATGAGKTWMAAAMIARRNVSVLYVVHTLDLLEQTKVVMENLLGMKVGIIGDGKLDIKKVTIGMVQSLGNVPSEKLNFDMVIVDETHHLPADSFYSVTGSIKARYVHGLSATPYRADKADLLIEAGAGPIVSKITPTELIQEGVLTPVVIRFVPIQAQTSYYKPPSYITYNEFIVKYDVRNELISHFAKEFVEKGNTVLIAVRQIGHIHQIRKSLQVDSVILDGKTPSFERKKILQKLKDREIKLVISTLMKEGVDVPSLDVVINAAGGTDSMQLVGRALRKFEGKKVATVIDFIDNQHLILQKASYARMNRLKEEPGFTVVVG